MSKFYTIFNWAAGLFFLLGGIGSLFDTPLAGVCLLVAAALLLPPVRKMIFYKTNKKFPAILRIAAVFSMFVLFGHFTNEHERSISAQEVAAEEKVKEEAIKEFNSNKSATITAINELIENAQYQEAISETNKLLSTNDPDIGELHSRAQSLQNELDKSLRTEELLSDLASSLEFNHEKRRDIYSELTRLHPNNEEYRESLSFHSEKVIERRQQAVRQENIESQFSSWDGSHRNLERLIKSSMNDPDSYDHVETTFTDNGDHLRVLTKFRGRNAFGGVVLDSVEAKVAINGQILEVIDNR